MISGERTSIKTDVVPKDIPLLLSKKAMKETKVNIDFVNDKIEILGKDLDMHCSTSGHYCIPIYLIDEIDQANKNDVFLSINEMNCSEDREKIALKLHRQFGHPNSSKLISLLQNANIDDRELNRLIENLSENCEICIKYQKNQDRPVTGFPQATNFNECVAMDLKTWSFHDNVLLIHLVDHLTRYSASSVIRSKRKEVIIESIFKIWISIFGSPMAVLVDNGGEFNNGEFSLCENFNINIKITAVESPWSNGLIERLNSVLGNIVSKMMSEEQGYSLNTAVAWAVSAKNSLKNVYGFSPNQLVFGKNPNFPSVMNNKLPALEGVTSSKIAAENLNVMHNARQAFIKAEADEKLRRALRHQVRTSSEVKFITGDKVYYKRRSDDTWKAPAVVIGQESQQVLIKHGSTYQRIHPCRLKLKYEPMNYKETLEVENSTNKNRDNVKSVNNGNDIRVPNDETELDANDEPLRTVTTTEDISQDTMMHSNDEQTGTEDNLKEYDDTKMPKIKENVSFIRKGSKDWEQATIHSRAGKRTGK